MFLNPLHDFVTNLALIISYLFITSQLSFHYRWLGPRMNRSRVFPLVVFGVINGMLGILVMSFSIDIGADIKIDLRQIAIVLPAVYGGFVPSIIAALIIGAWRTLFWGVTSVSVAACLTALLQSICCGVIYRLVRGSWRRCLLMVLCCCVLSSAVMAALIAEREVLFRVIPWFWFFSVAGALISKYLVDYLRRSRELLLRFQDLSLKDPLTGLHNARLFDLSLENNFAEAALTDGAFSLLIIDIDHFKNINDTYGHPAGDAVLRELGRIVAVSIRSEDVLCRNGGEEFSVQLPRQPLKKASEIAERIRRSVEHHPFHLPDGRTIGVTLSIGIAAYTPETETRSALLQRADKALYKAKEAGRNRICCHENDTFTVNPAAGGMPFSDALIPACDSSLEDCNQADASER